MRDANLEAHYVGNPPAEQDDDFEDRLQLFLDRCRPTDHAARVLSVSVLALKKFVNEPKRDWLRPHEWDGRLLWTNTDIIRVGQAMKAAGLR